VRGERRDLNELAERAYQLISRSPASLTQSGLGKRLGLKPKPISRIVAKLLEQGLVTRQPVKLAKRVHTYRLKPTERGRKLAELLFSSPSGILQSSLPNKLNRSEASVRRLVNRLVKMGWLVREPVVSRQVVRTFKLSPDPTSPLRSVVDIPCFCCASLDKCAHGTNLHPTSCQKLDGWLAEQVR